MEEYGHTPVLPGETYERLSVRPGEVVLDATIGAGGHASLLGAALGEAGVLVGLDVDQGNLEIARRRLSSLPCRVELARRNFAEAVDALAELGIAGVDAVLADLGVSSIQLDDPQRGFSFSEDGPLDMRMDDRLSTTAADLVNSLPENQLADLIFENGQEHYSRRIARRICAVRHDGRITRTEELAKIVAGAMRVNPTSRRSKIHPATRTFQALRIAVNDELGSLDRFLDSAPQLLRPGGRIGVISFHSLEDRRVKTDFRRRSTEGVYRIETRKPIVASQSERADNPRSRSAKLRVAVRLESEA